ncbi:hypothetical protein EJ04DRAFT_516849 [Polyplosphaeria fusca]|uniref:S-adenosyl-L-methionine-dependent methyltransferase n=1 Tax=Polyplosphaeria fusca TaxID=682080 RepID=A0A9P4QMB9_9PLEO|nr:hypothetical protein EJ04DRAFT_516849 [Polyplosphaeria fusca]
MSDLKEYGKGRDFVSSTKMNYFHYFLKQLTGYTLHPATTAAHGSSPLRIADMGVQTAIWALDVADDATLSATVDGFDVSDKFFPPPAWLPSNVTLHTHDITTPFPEALQGKFDVVHFRLFIMVPPEKMAAMLQQAVMLLKPGGCVQWVEHDKTRLFPITAVPGANTEAIDAMIAMEKEPFPNYNAAWVNDIGPAMREAGLEVVVEDRLQTKKSMLLQMNELHLLSLMDVPPGLSQAIDDFKEKWLDHVAEDNRRGVSSVDGFIWVVGRKPLA